MRFFILLGSLLSFISLAQEASTQKASAHGASTQETSTISGMISNYPGGTMNFEAMVFNPESRKLLGETTVAEEGTFQLELNPPAEENFSHYSTLFPADECNLSISDDSVRIALLWLGNRDARLHLASSEDVLRLSRSNFADATSQDKAGLLVYATTSSTIRGICQLSASKMHTSVFVKLEPGLNTLVMSFDKVEDEQKMLIRAALPNELSWFIANE
ncbi:MAG: hypothetical protein ACRCYY_07670 [Trueperaceae bacterium]